MSRLTGLARSTLRRGLDELETVVDAALARRLRRPGGVRQKLTETDPTLLSDLKELVEPATRGDPEAPLLWTSRSVRNLAEALCAMGRRVGHNVVANLLRRLNYSLQSNRKTKEGTHKGTSKNSNFRPLLTRLAVTSAAKISVPRRFSFSPNVLELHFPG